MLFTFVAKLIDDIWYSKKPWAITISTSMLLLSWCYRALIVLRQIAYNHGIFSTHRLPIPVIVVGNIVVGGSGKTPLVIYLAQHLKGQGYHPGIISRGYKGKSKQWPQLVSKDSSPRLMGDEAVLIARRTNCPIAVAPNRYAAAMLLLKQSKIDIIICDDGLQHHALARDIEIITIDGIRRHGNGRCLPAGPLREPAKRLQQVDIIVCNGATYADECNNQFTMEYTGEHLSSLLDNSRTHHIKQFAQQPVHAITGVGNPKKFFTYLRSQGLSIIEHPFPDHHNYTKQDIFFNDNLSVIMTEKDAVKCSRFASDRHWFLMLDITIPGAFLNQLNQLLRGCATKK